MNVFFKNNFRIFLTGAILISGIAVNISPVWAGAPSLIRDTEIENTLRLWGTPIFEAAGLDPNGVRIILAQSDTVNAFVAGGPNIFLYTGLINKTDNPGELIGVIAHETGHIAGGHLIRSREAMERASYESIMGMILGVGIAVASGDSNAISAISLGGNSLAQRRYLAHSRIHESSADQAALGFLEKAKINPSGLASFMDKLKADSFAPENQQSEYVRTHPLINSRIEAMERRIAESAYKGSTYPTAWQEQHARMKAKLIGFISPEKVAWFYDDKDTSIPAQYARAIAAYRNNQIDDALQRINALLKHEPNNQYFLELKGQMLVDFARIKEAIPYYKKAIEIMPKATLFRIALAHALIESANQNEPPLLRQAIEHLERALRDESRSTRIHRLLATAYGRINQHNNAKIHLAEEAVLQRRFSYAKQHAQSVLESENEGSKLWLKAKDIISFIETTKKE
ncbi:MAG: peptidase M48 family protein [Zetaproteobacteria bacterium]|nr:MAG: peptidase M48 family protein [Zetaproteobacteria bacterium]